MRLSLTGDPSSGANRSNTMDPRVWHRLAVLVLLTCPLVGCDKLTPSSDSQQSATRPSPQELRKISYMSQVTVGPDGQKVFDRLEQAKSCRDLELAMRWNRPPDVASGPFNTKMVYLSSSVPADLAKQSEVFVSGKIKRGQSLSSGSSGWSLKMKDGSEVQVIEPSDYWEKQEQAQQEGGAAAIVKPYTPGRTFCGRGIYQGRIGKSLDGQTVPLVEALFGMDRAK